MATVLDEKTYKILLKDEMNCNKSETSTSARRPKLECCVPACNGTNPETNTKYELYSFPKEWRYREKWFTYLRLDPNRYVTTMRICSKHFVPDFIEESGNLKETAVPTLYLFPMLGGSNVSLRNSINKRLRSKKCAICPNRRPHFILYRLPTEKKLLKVWQKACRLSAEDLDTPQKRAWTTICSVHFDIRDIGRKKLLKGAYPRYFLPPEESKPLTLLTDSDSDSVERNKGDEGRNYETMQDSGDDDDTNDTTNDNVTDSDNNCYGGSGGCSGGINFKKDDIIDEIIEINSQDWETSCRPCKRHRSNSTSIIDDLMGSSTIDCDYCEINEKTKTRYQNKLSAALRKNSEYANENWKLQKEIELLKGKIDKLKKTLLSP